MYLFHFLLSCLQKIQSVDLSCEIIIKILNFFTHSFVRDSSLLKRDSRWTTQMVWYRFFGLGKFRPPVEYPLMGH